MENKNFNTPIHEKKNCGLCHISTILKTEEWLNGLNKIPQKTISELGNHPIYKNIITRALLLLLDQLGIKTVSEFQNCIKNQAEPTESETEKFEESQNHEKIPLSPLSKEEFQNIMKNGWPRKSQSPVSPLSKKEFQNLMKNGLALNIPADSNLYSGKPTCTISPIKSETIIHHQNKKMSSTPLPDSKTPSNRALFTSSTPNMDRISLITKLDTSISKSTMKMSTMLESNNLKAQTPIRRHSIQRMSPYPVKNEGPLENRASRLRRQTIDEKRLSSLKKEDRKNISIEALNSTFSDLSLKIK